MTPNPDLDARLAERLIAEGLLVDPFLEGSPRVGATPVVLSRARWAELCGVAEAVTAVYNELCRLCADEPRHLDELFALTPCQKLMWMATAPEWHGFARADLFETPSGIVCCELNCDTPTGQPEAVLLNRAVVESHPGARDPNRRLEAAFCHMLERSTRRVLGEGFERTVGIVYPTELPEDLPLVHLYRRWLEARGFGVVPWPSSSPSPSPRSAG